MDSRTGGENIPRLIVRVYRASSSSAPQMCHVSSSVSFRSDAMSDNQSSMIDEEFQKQVYQTCVPFPEFTTNI